MTPDDLTHIEKTQDERDAVAYWQNSLAKFFPTSKGPTSSEVDMFISGRKGMVPASEVERSKIDSYGSGVIAGEITERERCAEIARDCHGCSGLQTAKAILNPPKDEAK